MQTVPAIILGDDLCQMTQRGQERLKKWVSPPRGPQQVMQKRSVSKVYTLGVAHHLYFFPGNNGDPGYSEAQTHAAIQTGP